MLGHDVPETIGFRPIRGPLVHQNGRSIGQRAIDNVTMPGDPTDICRAPVNIIILEVKDVFGGELGTQQVTSGSMQNPLGLASGSTGENIPANSAVGVGDAGQASSNIEIGRLRIVIIKTLLNLMLLNR